MNLAIFLAGKPFRVNMSNFVLGPSADVNYRKIFRQYFKQYLANSWLQCCTPGSIITCEYWGQLRRTWGEYKVTLSLDVSSESLRQVDGLVGGLGLLSMLLRLWCDWV